MTFPLIHTAYCLNLDRNITRWVESQKQFTKVGIDVQRINCIESEENRYISFNHSMIDTVKLGYATGQPFAIFEDDIILDPIWKHIEEASRELPVDWDLLYLGGNFMGDWQMPIRYSAHLSILPNAWQTHAIVYSMKGAKFAIDNFDPDTFPVYDEWIRVNIMPRGRTFMLTPMICYQRPGWSDLWQRDVNYVDVHREGNKYLKQL